jgi:hypothetical protein
MSFQAYLKTIANKTGKSPADFRKLAAQKGFTAGGKLAPGVKTGEIVARLKADFGLGHGHAMALLEITGLLPVSQTPG